MIYLPKLAKFSAEGKLEYKTIKFDSFKLSVSYSPPKSGG